MIYPYLEADKTLFNFWKPFLLSFYCKWRKMLIFFSLHYTIS